MFCLTHSLCFAVFSFIFIQYVQASDLKVLLQCYEHWAHRLFPKFPFENVVNQAEKLGHKKLVQVRINNYSPKWR